MLITVGAYYPLTPNTQEQILLSCPHTFLKGIEENLLKYQKKSPWVFIQYP